MKYFYMAIFLILTIISFADVYQIKKGEKAPISGVIIDSVEYSRMFEIMIIYNDTKLLEKNLISQLAQSYQLIELQKQQIDILQKKFELEQAFRLDIEKKLSRAEFKAKVFSITTSVGLSISFAELVGLGVFAILWNTMK